MSETATGEAMLHHATQINGKWATVALLRILPETAFVAAVFWFLSDYNHKRALIFGVFFLLFRLAQTLFAAWRRR